MRRVSIAALVATAALTGCGGGGTERVAAGELPQGDPGQAAPEVPEPTGEPEDHEDAPALSEVPEQALLDAATVAGVAGGRWTAAASTPTAVGRCGSLAADAAARSVRLTDGSRTLVQTVLSYEHGEDLEAVPALAQSFADCGWTASEAPPLGEASAAASGADGGSALVFSSEGAVVVLVGTGGLAADAGVWDALADVALGSACPAAPGGCH